MRDLLSCKKCPRIVDSFNKLKKSHSNYLNKPIIPILRKESSIAIVGLAPGLAGANRTGQIFNGDFSGDILNKAIKLSGINFKNNLLYPYITNAVKCYPPNNKPSISEIDNCNIFLKQELESLGNLKVVIALGHIAHNSILQSYSLAGLKKSSSKLSVGTTFKVNGHLNICATSAALSLS